MQIEKKSNNETKKTEVPYIAVHLCDTHFGKYLAFVHAKNGRDVLVTHIKQDTPELREETLDWCIKTIIFDQIKPFTDRMNTLNSERENFADLYSRAAEIYQAFALKNKCGRIDYFRAIVKRSEDFLFIMPLVGAGMPHELEVWAEWLENVMTYCKQEIEKHEKPEPDTEEIPSESA